MSEENLHSKVEAESETSFPRPRGAQPGNANALKHGRFAKPQAESTPDDPLPEVSLQKDIDCVRVGMLLAIRLIFHCEEMSDKIRLIRSLAKLADSLQILLKTERLLLTSNDTASRAIKQSLQTASPRLLNIINANSNHHI